MLKKLLFFALLALLFALPKSGKASHIAGGEVTYTCLGSNQYEINLNLYWDCTGGFDPGSTQSITIESACGPNINVTVNQVGTGTDITQICGSVISSCSGGTFPGMMMNTYTAIVTLPPCDGYTISWTTCCRNAAIDNLETPSSFGSYLETTLNSATAPCNTSPYFTAQPIPYVCAGQEVNYSYGVVETDGDSLYYSLIAAMDGGGTPLTYAAGYSATSPIPGITIDPVTGLLNFTPTAIGNYVVVVLVQEYDDAGNLIGTIMRDIQFVVQACSNVVPDPSGGAVTSLTGTAVQTGPYSIEMCAGNNFTLTATYTDPDAGDILAYITNLLTALPGATITSSGTNPLTLTISWTAPASMAGVNCTFSVTVEDDNCPIPGQQTWAYYVNVLDATTTNPDVTICGSQTAQLNAYGGSIFTWGVVSGDPITPSNFSCNPCSNPVATPAVTTTYWVQSNLSGSCDNLDTVTVFIVPDFSYSMTTTSASSCLMQPVQLGITGLTPAGPGYTYSWTPPTYLSSTTISNPVVTATSPGTYTYSLTVTSADGCTKSDNVTITVIPAVSPIITAYSDTTFCIGGTATLGVDFGSGVPATCGLSLTGSCGGTGATVTLGTGTTTNTSTGYPAIYSNWYQSAKHQMLFTASELLAAGLVPGKIDQIDLPITVVNGTTLYRNFRIMMGCTNLASITTWQSGLVTVFNPADVNIAVGWNSYLFDNAFEWDGISNIIVEICSDNTMDPGFTLNSESPYTTTTFNSVVHYHTDGMNACPTTSYAFDSPSMKRPNMRMHNCTIAADPADYSYLWTPASGGIASPTSQNTTAVPSGVTTYYITVTDIAGGCSATDSVQVDAIDVSALAIDPSGPHCVNGAIATITTNMPTGTGTFSGPGITDGTNGTFDPALAGVGSHTITYTISGTCGAGSETITVDVIPQPDATITSPGNQCSTGPVITLTAGYPGGVWSGTGITDPNAGTFDPVVAGVGSWTITYTLTSPCAASDTEVIDVTTQLDATITDVGPFCTNEPIMTLAAVDPGGTWSGPGIIDPIAGTFDPSVAGAGNQVITYTITGLCGNTDNSTISIIAAPIISITSDVNEGCEPTTVNFSSINNQPGGTCFWDFGNGNTSTGCNPQETYTVFGYYDVTFTYANTIGCSTTITQDSMIVIHSQPFAEFSVTPQPTTMLDPTLQFTDLSTGLVDTWLWDFGTSDISTLANPSYTYADTGQYVVTLTVTNIYGCVNSIQHPIYIEPIHVFYAPTGFTPDDDGINDEFMVYGDGMDPDSFMMRIYNRWGEMIFQSNDIYKGWNGRRGNIGEMCEQAVYVWKINVKDYDGRPKQYIGHVTLTK